MDIAVTRNEEPVRYCPSRIETVAAATSSLIVSEKLSVLRMAPPAEVFNILQRDIAQSIFAYIEATNNFGIEPSDE